MTTPTLPDPPPPTREQITDDDTRKLIGATAEELYKLTRDTRGPKPIEQIVASTLLAQAEATLLVAEQLRGIRQVLAVIAKEIRDRPLL